MSGWILCGAARSGPPGLPMEWADDDPTVPCCAGSVDAPDRCTCWEPVHDAAQQAPVDAAERTRQARCHDCAFRPDSREQHEGTRLPRPDERPFYCHAGMRRVVAWRHPDGRELPAAPDDYAPPTAGGLLRKADGTPADVCAGWARQELAT